VWYKGREGNCIGEMLCGRWFVTVSEGKTQGGIKLMGRRGNEMKAATGWNAGNKRILEIEGENNVMYCVQN
jgi:hypothetical protein